MSSRRRQRIALGVLAVDTLLFGIATLALLPRADNSVCRPVVGSDVSQTDTCYVTYSVSSSFLVGVVVVTAIAGVLPGWRLWSLRRQSV